MKIKRLAPILKAALLLAVALRMVCLTSFHDPGDNDFGASPRAAGWQTPAPAADTCPACRMDTLLVGSPAIAPPIDAPPVARAPGAIFPACPESLTVPPGVGRAPPPA